MDGSRRTALRFPAIAYIAGALVSSGHRHLSRLKEFLRKTSPRRGMASAEQPVATCYASTKPTSWTKTVFAGLALRSALASRTRTSIVIRYPLPTRVPYPPLWPRADGKGRRWDDRDSSSLPISQWCLCRSNRSKVAARHRAFRNRAGLSALASPTKRVRSNHATGNWPSLAHSSCKTAQASLIGKPPVSGPILQRADGVRAGMATVARDVRRCSPSAVRFVLRNTFAGPDLCCAPLLRPIQIGALIANSHGTDTGSSAVRTTPPELSWKGSG